MRRRRPADRLYRAFLAVFPPDMREADADEMVRLFADQRRAARSIREQALLWLMVAWDALRHGFGERLGRWRIRRMSERQASGPGMRGLGSDLRFAGRIYRHSPASTGLAVLAMMLGIGASTAVVSFAEALFARPLGIASPSGVVALFHVSTDGQSSYSSFSRPDYVDLTGDRAVLAGVVAWSTLELDLNVPRTDTIEAQIVSGNFFSTLGVAPLLGRTFAPDEDATPGTHPVVVLSEGFWRQQFGGDPGAIGATLQLNGSPFQVIGVVPRRFRGLELASSPRAWIPLMMHAVAMPSFRIGDLELFDSRGTHWLDLAGRLAPGVDAARAEVALRAIADRMARDHPDTNGHWSITVAPATASQLGPPGTSTIAHVTWVLMAVVGFVLVIACANVAILLLARAVSRRREIGIRLAIGASRRRLVRQLLTESLALALIGGALGVGLAYALIRMVPIDTMVSLSGLDVRLNLPVLAIAVAITVVCGVAFGLAPALQASAPGVTGALKDEELALPRSGGRVPLGSLLIGAQVALCLVLSIGAGLAARTVVNLRSLPLGFDPHDLWTAGLDLTSFESSPSAGRQYYGRALSTIRSMPGVESADVALMTPFGAWRMANDIFWQPGDSDGGRRRTNVDMNIVGPDYFAVMQIPILRGRAFGDEDRPGAADVAIVNRSLARRLWGDADPLGRRISYWNAGGTDRPVTIIGVAEDGRYYRSWRSSSRPFLFLPFSQWYQGNMTLHVRGADLTADRLRSALTSIDRRVAVRVTAVDEAMRASIMVERLNAALFGSFSFVGLVLSLVGIYGVVAFSVGARTTEIGVRQALGATPNAVVGLVVARAVRPVLAGLAIGWVAALGFTRWISALLFGLTSSDPATYVTVALAVLAASALAGYVPARRAARIDPLRAIRGG